MFPLPVTVLPAPLMVLWHLVLSATSPEIALQHKSRPVRKRTPLGILPHLLLRASQRLGSADATAQHRRIKALHKNRGGPVVDLPQARHHLTRAGIKEASRESQQPFASEILSQRRLAPAQHHQARVHAQLI